MKVEESMKSTDKPFLLANKAYKQFTDFENGRIAKTLKSLNVIYFLYNFEYIYVDLGTAATSRKSKARELKLSCSIE